MNVIRDFGIRVGSGSVLVDGNKVITTQRSRSKVVSRHVEMTMHDENGDDVPLIPVAIGAVKRSSGNTVKVYELNGKTRTDQVIMDFLYNNVAGYWFQSDWSVWFELEEDAVSFKLWIDGDADHA